MAMEDDIFGAAPRPKLPGGHEVGSDVSTLSEAELEERMDLLKAEIERLRTALEAKRASRTAADAFFKT
ncbi:MAG TPA: DUF1192 domain-containing protein [Ancylobacter sp.]